jgi:hypothetical protein
MVHALGEIRRVLVPGGTLIDIRPLGGRWPVEVASQRGVQQTGRVDDLPAQVDGDIAANEAMRDVESRGWFEREQEELFPFLYTWDTPSEIEEFIAEDWSDFIELNEAAKRATRSAWASAEAQARVQVRVQVLIARWSVVKE